MMTCPKQNALANVTGKQTASSFMTLHLMLTLSAWRVIKYLMRWSYSTDLNAQCDQKELQFSSVTQLCLTLCDPMDYSMPSLPVHHQLPEPTQTHVHWVSDAIQPSHPLSSPSPPAFNLFQHQGLFQWVSFFASGGQSIRVSAPSISPSTEYSGLISFRMDWLDLLAAQGTLKSLLQHHSSKASILRSSAFFWADPKLWGSHPPWLLTALLVSPYLIQTSPPMFCFHTI